MSKFTGDEECNRIKRSTLRDTEGLGSWSKPKIGNGQEDFIDEFQGISSEGVSSGVVDVRKLGEDSRSRVSFTGDDKWMNVFIRYGVEV